MKDNSDESYGYIILIIIIILLIILLVFNFYKIHYWLLVIINIPYS